MQRKREVLTVLPACARWSLLYPHLLLRLCVSLLSVVFIRSSWHKQHTALLKRIFVQEDEVHSQKAPVAMPSLPLGSGIIFSVINTAVSHILCSSHSGPHAPVPTWWRSYGCLERGVTGEQRLLSALRVNERVSG